MEDNLNAIIAQLQALDDALYQQRLAATSDEEREALSVQSHAISTRIERLQGLMFAQASRDFSGEVAAIGSAAGEVKAAIGQIDQLNAVLGGITQVLGIADTVIGLF